MTTNKDDTMLNANESAFLQRNMMWGSDMYPIQKLNNGKWIWNDYCGVTGAPTVYRTKRAAAEAIARYLGVLLDKHAGRR